MLLGLGAAAPIGPVNLEIARRTLRHGFIAGLALGCGAVTVDVTYAILTSLSIAPLLKNGILQWDLYLAGSLVITILGIQSLRGAIRPPQIHPDDMPAPTSPHGHYFTGLLMTFFNPMTLTFWFLAVPQAVGQVTADPRHDLAWVCLGVFVATLSWVFCFSGAIALLGQWKGVAWVRIADLAAGLLLLGFAATGFWHLLHAPAFAK